ncbi:phage tail protein [Pseudomonas sp. C2B4]|nr:phage tail assembly chaperone [Pseudomonas sp. C2B4]NUU35629.1 phage tail protein [Pseudomonas sp. C2B4]
MPDDGFFITDELHRQYLEEQAMGKIIDFSTSPPSLAERARVEVTYEQLIGIERRWRNGTLAITDCVVTRQRDELEQGTATTLTAEQYLDLQVYRRKLRDWPQTTGFPEADQRPVAPPWLTKQEQ